MPSTPPPERTRSTGCGSAAIEPADYGCAMPRGCHVRGLRRRAVACPAARAIAAVQDIKSIERTEVKADRVEVTPASDSAGTYAVTGHFAGVPWRSRFAYRLHASGFHS